jgi:PEP-CTERM motif
MTKRTNTLASIAAIALGVLAATSAEARYVVIFEEDGSNVVETGGGTIDLTGLSTIGARQAVFPQIEPSLALFVSGTEFSEVTIYDGVAGPSNFGSGGMTSASQSSGDGIVLGLGSLDVPEGYMSGSPLSETSTYLGANFASLGMTPGAYVWTWGTGEHADSLTINIVAGGSVPEPSTWAMVLIGFAGLGYATIRRRHPRVRWGS